MDHTGAREVGRAVFWVAVYLSVVSAPLLVLLVGPRPPPSSFWGDFAIALGFAGLAMMGVQFALTARIKRATAPFGIDVIYYFHRYAAVVAFGLVLAHPVLLLAENPALLEYLNPLKAPWHMTVGLGSVVALVVVTASSLWRKRLGLHYDAWRVLHAVLAAAAVVAALVHVLAVGVWVAEPWKRGLWTLYTASWVVVLLYVRVARPWRLARRPWRIAEVREERGDAFTLAVEPRGHAGLTFQPGQFAWLTARHGPFAMREHPFSFSSAPAAGGRVEFTIKALGDFTRTVGSLSPGETVYVDGPYGAFSIDRHPAPGYVFLAGGIGIAPVMSMLRALADREDGRPHVLFYAYRRWERLTFREDLQALAHRLRLEVVHVLEEPPEDWTGERGWIDAAMLDRRLPRGREGWEYFVCGPTAMNEAMERALRSLGVPRRRMRSELFDLV